MRDLKKLNEEMVSELSRSNQLKENDSIEVVTDSANDYVDEFVALVDKHEVPDNKTIAEILLPRVADLTVAEVKSIMEDYSLIGHDQSIFPSNWNRENGDYPVVFAQALTQSNVAEDETDIFNVFYCNRDLSQFKNAINVWQEGFLKKLEAKEDIYSMDLAKEAGQEEFVKDVFGTIQDYFPRFMDKVNALAVKNYDIDLKEIINK